jgi:hypothetical protein
MMMIESIESLLQNVPHISDHCLMASVFSVFILLTLKIDHFPGSTLSHAGECSFLVASFIVHIAYCVDLCQETCHDN